MKSPLTVFREWYESVPDSNSLAFVTLKIRAGFPGWEPLPQGSPADETRADVVTRIKKLEEELDSFQEEGAALSLAALTDIQIEWYATEDQEAWMRRMKKMIRVGSDFLMKTAKEAILSRDDVLRERAELAMSWAEVRSGPLSTKGFLAWEDYLHEEAMGEAGRAPDVVQAAERMRRRLAGEPEEQ